MARPDQCGRDHGLTSYGDQLGIGGSSGHTGKLVFFHGDDASQVVPGKTEIPRWTWHHVALVRDGEAVRIYLNGNLEMETTTAANFPTGLDQFFIGGRGDNNNNWEGRLDEAAIFDRALTVEEVGQLGK